MQSLRSELAGTPFRYDSGRLSVDGIPLERIARSVGTPVYVYSAKAVQDRFDAFRGALAGLDPLICYAMKANSSLALCARLARKGAGADVVSGGEIEIALRAGFLPSRIVFSGVGKTEEEIRLALRRNILAIHVESEEELAAVARSARRLRRRAPIAVRLNPGVDAHTHRHVTTGRLDNKFGVDLAAAVVLYRKARRNLYLTPVGVQTHIGSQIGAVGPYGRALAATLSLVGRLAREGLRLSYVDIGGGMGISYHGEPALSLTRLSEEIRRRLRPWPNLRLLLEPGRYLTADAGALLTRVLYRKATGRSRFVIVDAAMNDLIRPALYGAYHPIVPVGMARGGMISMDVVGPVCETADCFAKGRRLPRPKPGDVWAILKAGAYGFSMASQYNARPRPPEVLTEGGRFRVVRTRETFEDLIRHER